MIAPASPKHVPYAETGPMYDEQLADLWLEVAGNELKRLRKYRGYTQKTFVELSDWSEATISKMERGKTLTFKNIIRYCSLVEVDTTAFWKRVSTLVEARLTSVPDDYPQ